ncbi:MAG: DNA mismatch repair endonuclease MutL [Bacilli bacterium]|nr:DNA mismatch repair endonuclease MutL [Bacilli bacterium]
MSQIALMKPELANLIAAGEVIERPSSVIKELVENSIDAHAKNIYVGVSDAGRGSIMVKDDGDGMDRFDARTCFLRHASSKIKTEYDLSRIHTLGFRGEAIPSIAAVSKVILTTTYKDEVVGTRVESNPNEDLIITDAPSRKGTIFEVKNLFFNTPARLKYLKSAKVETYSIIETVEHLALGFPNISFSLAVDGKEIFRTSGRGDLLEAIQKIYGNVIAQALYPVKKEGVAFSFTGYVGKPEINYSRRKDMLTFLNNRCIYDYKINKGIEDAYKDYLPPLRYPFCIIDLSIDSSLVDVNVHPTKKEVRISMEDDIAREIREEVLKTLESRKPIYFASQDNKSEKLMGDNEEAFDISDIQEQDKLQEQVIQDYADVKPLKSDPFPRYVQDSLPIEPTYELRSPHDPVKPVEPKPFTPASQSFESFLKENTQSTSDIPSEKKPEADYNGNDYYNTIFNNEGLSYKLPEMHPIGQVLQTYVLCDGIDCFYILDQHAAAERVNYEKTQALFASVRSRVVPLFPITLELSPKEKINYDEEHINRLNSLGIITEEFGGNTIKVMEIPSFLSEKNDEEVISDCVHACLNDESSDPLNLLHLTIANIACKKSIKANHKMSLFEIEALLKDLAKCKNPANCPHGRPTIIKISRADIERMFRRTGF